MYKINYEKISRYESALIGRVIDRVMDLCEDHNYPLRSTQRTQLEMDLCAAHLDTQLELHRMLECSSTDLLHDVFGIQRHLDRETGKLTSCFLPRCALLLTEVNHEID